MSTIFRRVTVTSTQYECHVFCDLCKQKIVEAYGRNDEVEISARIGTVWPENDTRDVVKLDCCVTCFTSKVRPLLETQLGAVFHEDVSAPGYHELSRVEL